MSTPTASPEESARRADYRAMNTHLQAIPPLPGYPASTAAALTEYLLAFLEANARPFSKGERQAITNHFSNLANTTASQTLRRTLRSRATQHRLQITATYDAAFRAGYRARKILHQEHAQRSYQRGYAKAQEQHAQELQYAYRNGVSAAQEKQEKQKKQQKIRTLQELKDLPCHAVVKDSWSRIYEQTPAKGTWYAVGWESERSVNGILLPAQVLA